MFPLLSKDGGSNTASCPGQTASHSSSEVWSPEARPWRTGWSGGPSSATASSPTSSASGGCPPGSGRGSPPCRRSSGLASWGQTRPRGSEMKWVERCMAVTGGCHSNGPQKSVPRLSKMASSKFHQVLMDFWVKLQRSDPLLQRLNTFQNYSNCLYPIIYRLQPMAIFQSPLSTLKLSPWLFTSTLLSPWLENSGSSGEKGFNDELYLSRM